MKKSTSNINSVLIGAGEPGLAAIASTNLDGRILLYKDGRKEFHENNSLSQMLLKEHFLKLGKTINQR